MAVDNDKILEKIMEFHGDFREFRGEITARMGQVEEDAAEAKKWENYKIYAILPITAGLHAIASKLGLIKG
jgi:hypothetical protein